MSLMHRVAGLGLAAFMALAVPGVVEAGHRHSRDCGHRYSRYDRDYRYDRYDRYSRYDRGRGYRPYRSYGYYGYRAPRYRGSRYGWDGYYGYPPPPVYYGRGHRHLPGLDRDLLRILS